MEGLPVVAAPRERGSKLTGLQALPASQPFKPGPSPMGTPVISEIGYPA
jgi:hypothetical protein